MVPAGGPFPPVNERVVRSDEEWHKSMDGQRFYVMREEGTERAFTGAYWNKHDQALYVCGACGNPLFTSKDKFDSGTGWPSFTRPMEEGRVAERQDSTLGMERTEVHCARCGGHLGHVFEDGPLPTGLRYCINSVSLKAEALPAPAPTK
jgi:peptide-methionine (R)-S-oxide reductase